MIAVALSGGVDSMAALLYLREAGYATLAIHGVFSEDQGVNNIRINKLREICKKLDTPLKIVYLQKKFEKLIKKRVIAEARKGKTSNPCAWCNRFIKFGALQKFAQLSGCEFFATGHYAKLVKNPYCSINSKILAPAFDTHKNQTYFLSLLKFYQLSNVLFPLGNCHKKDIKKFVSSKHLEIPENKESQDLCFDRGKLLSNSDEKPGKIILKENYPGLPLGYHQGLSNYTIGQRKGLNIAYSEPLYVSGKDFVLNNLYVSKREFLSIFKITCKIISFHVPQHLWPEKIFIRMRYKSELISCSIKNSNGNIITFQFSAPVFPAAPGQISAIYDQEERILAGGIII